MINLTKFSSFFIANWKLNGDFKFIDSFLKQLKITKNNKKCIVIAPNSIYLNYIISRKKNFFVSSQNTSIFENGAYTGEISSTSLNDLGVDFCIIGHSERRQYFNEDDETIKIKAKSLINNNIAPVICIGETIEERKNGKTEEKIENQIRKCIPDNSNNGNTILAYEPLWAIGSGLTPSLDEIDKTHENIRNISVKFNNYAVLYGGSLNVKNYQEIVDLPNVNGGLIGGASLKINDFNQIIA